MRILLSLMVLSVIVVLNAQGRPVAVRPSMRSIRPVPSQPLPIGPALQPNQTFVAPPAVVPPALVVPSQPLPIGPEPQPTPTPPTVIHPTA